MQQDGNDCASKLRARTLVRSRDGQYEECAQGGERGGSGEAWWCVLPQGKPRLYARTPGTLEHRERASEEQTVG